MSSTILAEALNYIDFLKSLGFYVSLSCFDAEFLPYFDKLKNYEIHLHNVCFFLKQHRKTQGKCLLNKKMLGETKITEPYYSCCYAGVEEFVIPIMHKKAKVRRLYAGLDAEKARAEEEKNKGGKKK